MGNEDYTQYQINSSDAENMTVRNISDSEDRQETVSQKEAGEFTDIHERKTERYLDYAKYQREPGEGTTVKLSEFDSAKIDPVAVVLSDSQREGWDVRAENLSRYTPLQSRSETSQSSPDIQPKYNSVIKEPSLEFMKPVGWLVCVEGPDFGKSFSLHSGKNRIGRSDAMDVVLKNDLAVSRKEHAWIEYREDERRFYVSTGENKKLIYVNDNLVLTPEQMEKNDILYLGDSGLMLIPCCDERFSWQSVSANNGGFEV